MLRLHASDCSILAAFNDRDMWVSATTDSEAAGRMLDAQTAFWKRSITKPLERAVSTSAHGLL